VTTLALIDTDCDPDSIDLPIPGNDDGIRSIEVVLRHLADAIASGRQVSVQAKKDAKDAKDASRAQSQGDKGESA
jgi:small subunit ribosomal protein S2